jgi:hypothetical protein
MCVHDFTQAYHAASVCVCVRVSECVCVCEFTEVHRAVLAVCNDGGGYEMGRGKGAKCGCGCEVRMRMRMRPVKLLPVR